MEILLMFIIAILIIIGLGKLVAYSQREKIKKDTELKYITWKELEKRDKEQERNN